MVFEKCLFDFYPVYVFRSLSLSVCIGDGKGQGQAEPDGSTSHPANTDSSKPASGDGAKAENPSS